jgi:hypothetical protein
MASAFVINGKNSNSRVTPLSNCSMRGNRRVAMQFLGLRDAAVSTAGGQAGGIRRQTAALKILASSARPLSAHHGAGLRRPGAVWTTCFAGVHVCHNGIGAHAPEPGGSK